MLFRTGLWMLLAALAATGCKKSSADRDDDRRREAPVSAVDDQRIAQLKANRMVERPSASAQLVPIAKQDLAEILAIGAPARPLGEPELAPGAVQAIARYCYPGATPEAASELLASALSDAGWTAIAPRPHPSRAEVGLTAQHDGFRVTARIDDGDGGARCGDQASFAELTLLRVHRSE